MGRAKFFRQKLISHVDSVAVKTVYSWLLHQTRERFGVAVSEAEQVAQKGYLLLTRTLVNRSEEQIVFAAVGTGDPSQVPGPRPTPAGGGTYTLFACAWISFRSAEALGI